MKLGEVRKLARGAAKNQDLFPIKVAPCGEGTFSVRFHSHADIAPVVVALEAAGLKASRRRQGQRVNVEVEGTRWDPNWVVLFYAPDAPGWSSSMSPTRRASS